MDVTYILPIRCAEHRDGDERADLVASLAGIAAAGAEVLVVDNSDAEAFADHAVTFGGIARHLAARAPNAEREGRRRADRHPRGAARARGRRRRRRALRRRDARRGGHEARRGRRRRPGERVRPVRLARPMGYGADGAEPRRTGDRLPRHARGCVAAAMHEDRRVRRRRPVREPRAAADGRGAGGRIRSAPRVYVRRQPRRRSALSSDSASGRRTTTWRSRRKLATMLAIAPALGAAIARRRSGLVAAAAGASIALAEVGQAKGRRHPRLPDLRGAAGRRCGSAERAVCVWIAFWRGINGRGVQYGRGRLTRAATSTGRLRDAVAAGEPIALPFPAAEIAA